jgi:hypothetical protein
VTTHPHPVPRSKIRGSIHPFSHTSSLFSVQLVKHRKNFTFFTFTDKFCHPSSLFSRFEHTSNSMPLNLERLLISFSIFSSAAYSF